MPDPLGIAAPVGPIATIEPHVAPSIGNPPASTGDHGASNTAPAPPTERALGTLIDAVLITPPAGSTASAGTQFLLRVVAPDADPAALADRGLLTGTVSAINGNETLLATPLGLLALQRRLNLPPGATIAFSIIETIAAPAATADETAGFEGWRALEDALAALATTAPHLAATLQAELAPQTPTALTGNMLWLLREIYQGGWLGAEIAQLAASGETKLAKRLTDDLARFRRWRAGATGGDWDVFTLPVLCGEAILPVHLFLSRREINRAAAARFALEIELRHFGAVQLDVLWRDRRVILVLRSHHALPPALVAALKAAFGAALPLWQMTGDFSTATGPRFPIDPLAQLHDHVALTI